ncbi:hypothetical protein NDU88_001399 [Pleurodeles waltl]|uniref:Uncharacterized protein n=1 Tax=Pleurodeles waltl TaxID=8319 RepID=A0AAV7WI78_PLEWA|nr:hypothetical protein NDU88_001399 [Pleurodeles waltl]
MESEAKVMEAVALLRQAGRLDLLREGALALTRPARRASAGVAAAVAACSPPRIAAVSKVRAPFWGAVARGGHGAGLGKGYGRERVGETPRVSREQVRDGRRACGLPAQKWKAGPRAAAGPCAAAGQRALGKGQVGALGSSAAKGIKEKAAGALLESRSNARRSKGKGNTDGEKAPSGALNVSGAALLVGREKRGRSVGTDTGLREVGSSPVGGQPRTPLEQEAEGDPKIPLSGKWPTMLQWSSDEEGGDWWGDGGRVGGGAPSAGIEGAPARHAGEGAKEGEVRGLEEGLLVVGLEGEEVGGVGGQWVMSSSPGTSDLSWQGQLDYSDEDPGELDAARVHWGEGKAGPGAASRISSSGWSKQRSGAADASTGRYGGEGIAPPVAAAQKEQRPGSSRRRSKQRGEYSSCVRCGGTGASAVECEEGSEESLEEGELRNSGSEYEWWERGGQGTSNPVRKSLQVQRSGTRHGERRGERKGGEARTVQERTPLLSAVQVKARRRRAQDFAVGAGHSRAPGCALRGRGGVPCPGRKKNNFIVTGAKACFQADREQQRSARAVTHEASRRPRAAPGVLKAPPLPD